MKFLLRALKPSTLLWVQELFFESPLPNYNPLFTPYLQPKFGFHKRDGEVALGLQ